MNLLSKANVGYASRLQRVFTSKWEAPFIWMVGENTNKGGLFFLMHY